MKVIKYRIALFSNNPDRLVKFYVNVLGFKKVLKVNTKDDYGFSVEAAKGYKLWIAKHSEVKGKNKNPFKIILSFYVDNINDYFLSVKSHSTSKIIEEPMLVCSDVKGEERLVGSFLDPDGNCIQLMQLTGN